MERDGGSGWREEQKNKMRLKVKSGVFTELSVYFKHIWLFQRQTRAQCSRNTFSSPSISRSSAT